MTTNTRAAMLFLIVAASGVTSAFASQLVRANTSALMNTSAQETPMARVVTLIQELASRVEADGQAEQASYDQYACWCEDTLARKASDIATAKETITELTTLIEKLKAEIATHGSEIENMNSAIEANLAAQKEAAEVRSNGNQEYMAERTESEQCIGALEAAIKVLTGAGAEKKGFLETMQTAQLLSIVAGVRSVLKRPTASRSLSDHDLEMVHNFIDRPQDFMDKSSAMSAVQIAQNPFGDYAPQSTQIQGILKGMYDAFTADLEKANAEESEEQKAFEALMATKKAELATLQATLQRHTLDKAEKSKTEAESKQQRDDTDAQLRADEKFFEETKAGCQAKASDWNERSRLRTEELQGMRKAIEILSGGSETFVNATSTFLQTAAIDRHADGNQKAWQRLTALAQKFQSAKLAKLAAEFKTSGHFDKVIEAIDKMIALLRQEEQDDIAHRDRCQGSTNKNNNDMADLQSSIAKTDQALARMQSTADELTAKINTLDGEINATKEDMADLLNLRNRESASFITALQDDMDAVALLEKAIVALSEFYTRNKMEVPYFIQKQPEYSVDQDKAPETTWDGANYGGRKSESGGIIAILSMLKEDMEMEMKEGRAEDAAAQKEYEEQRGAMQSSLDAQMTTKTATEVEHADLRAKMQEAEDFKTRENNDLTGATDQQAALAVDCSWVATHFDSRATKRKTELQGLQDAKSYLAGVEAGTEV